MRVFGAIWLCRTVAQVVFQSQSWLSSTYDPDRSVICSWPLKFTAVAHLDEVLTKSPRFTLQFSPFDSLIPWLLHFIAWHWLFILWNTNFKCVAEFVSVRFFVLRDRQFNSWQSLLQLSSHVYRYSYDWEWNRTLTEGLGVLSGGTLSASIDTSSYVELPEVLMLN